MNYELWIILYLCTKILRYMKRFVFVLSIITLFIACNKDDDYQEIKADRTVLVYISGECSLWDYVDSDLEEMKTGSQTIGDNNLVVYVDRGNTEEIPWLARISKGQLVDSVSIKDIVKKMDLTPVKTSVTDDPYSSEAQVMEGVLRYAFNKYPSKNNDYGLVLWGHGTGWLIQDSISYNAMARKKAYGIDNGKNGYSDIGKWLNFPSMAKLLSKLPHLTFIFGDCCHTMCLEIAYELRYVTDYLIGTPAEIPGVGAPYDTIVPALFERTTFWQSIIDRYYEQKAGGYELPLSVIKTSEIENLANATKTVLKTFGDKFQDNETYPDLSDLIHYYYNYFGDKQIYYDANDFILKYASTNEYNTWKKALDQAVIYKKMATRWMTNLVPRYGTWTTFYGDFEMTEEKYGGVSMHIPQWKFQNTYNKTIKQMGWYYAAGYSDIGW